MAVNIEHFFGGGYDAGTLSANVQLPDAPGRIIKCEGHANNGKVYLPRLTGKTRRQGFPHFMVFNVSDTYSTVVESFGGGAPFQFLAKERCLFVGIGDDGTWRFMKNVQFEQGAPI